MHLLCDLCVEIRLTQSALSEQSFTEKLYVKELVSYFMLTAQYSLLTTAFNSSQS